jgi:putative transcriptional regulator
VGREDNEGGDMKKQRSNSPRKLQTNAAGRQILTGLAQAARAASTGDYSGMVVRRVEAPDLPGTYTPADVKALRARLEVTQALFAQMLGVSLKLVQAWEQGAAPLRPWARRLLDLISADPKAFRRRVMGHRTVA